MRLLNVKTYTAHLVSVAAAISLSLVAGCKSPTTAACKPGTVLVKVSCPAGAAGGELKVRVTDNQRVTEELSVGTCGGERSAFSAEFAFDDLKAVGALSATVKLVEGAAVLASTSSSPQLLDSQECLVLEPAWPLGTEDGGAMPVGGKGGGGTGGGDDADAGIGGSGGVVPPPECQAGDPPRSCLGAAGNCAKGTESCVAGKWGECSVKKATKDLCDVLGDDADCDGAPNKGCSCVPGEPAVCGPPTEQGICKKGKQACMNGTLGACAEAVYAKPRDCTSAGDNDCDGKIDNVVDGICQCPVGASQACQSPELAGTTCKPNTGTQSCVANAEKTSSTWAGCTGGVCISCMQGAACDLGVGGECYEGKLTCSSGNATCMRGALKADGASCATGACKSGVCCKTPPPGCTAAGVTYCATENQQGKCEAAANGCLQQGASISCGLGEACAAASCSAKEWNAQWGTSSYDNLSAIAMDLQGNTFVAGSSSGNLSGNRVEGENIFLSKVDASGKVLWTRQFSTFDAVKALTIDESGNVVIVGFGAGIGLSDGKSDGFVRKMTKDGAVVWTTRLPTAGYDFVNSVALGSDGSIFVGGTTYGAFTGAINAGAADAFVAKLTREGAHVWTRQWGTASADEVRAVALGPDAKIVAAGYTGGALEGASAGGEDAFVRKFNQDSSFDWGRQWGTAERDDATSVAIDADGNIFVPGSTSGNLQGPGSKLGGEDAFLSKLAPGGVLTWTRQWGSPMDDFGRGVSLDGSGGVVVAGFTLGSLEGSNLGMADAFVRKFTGDGTLQLTRQWGTANFDNAAGITRGPTDTLVVGGTTEGAVGPTNFGETDVYLKRMRLQ